ncbi:M66 family metalloprotease [Candidatus Palauibacter sp.]|uniref:M66 family metalloprotease n=1 Tax=Candidatus Palauibacter sp. TaxID=3101350 RepID=UPI003B023EF2
MLLTGGTRLCAPSDPGFQAWLTGIYKRRVAPCVERDLLAAYLAQAVQSRELPVPLVAGRRALLRVFPTADQATSEGIPAVRARFYRDGRETHVEAIPGTSVAIPTSVDESNLSKSTNAEIPGHIIQPGLEMVIEVDPDGTLDPGLGVAARIPDTGRLPVEVRTMPLFDLTLIPFIWSRTQDSSIVDLVRGMAADPENHELFADARALLPIGDLAVTAHEPVLTSTNRARAVLNQTSVIRAMEGGTGHYKGMMMRPLTASGRGVAKLPGRSSFSLPEPDVIAHELGHNLNLRHAPCGGAGGPDPSFPYSGGSIGTWGYDFRRGRPVWPSTPDFMSYCGPPDWISDYHFTNALRFRLSEADSVGLPDRAQRTKALLLWGGVGAEGVPFLEPVFVVDAPPERPRSRGAYQLSGHSAAGDELFSFGFDMPEVADGDGSSGFAFVLPVRPGWERDLASITLSGPGGSVTLDGETDRPVAILRDPRTGIVRGILQDLPPTAATRADAVAAVSPEPGLEVLFSRGIPGSEEWRR